MTITWIIERIEAAENEDDVKQLFELLKALAEHIREFEIEIEARARGKRVPPVPHKFSPVR